MLDLFWSTIGLDNGQGRFVTITSFNAFLSGWIFFYITYIIIKHDLIELNKVRNYELISIVTLGFSNVVLFFNNIFITYGFYSYDSATLIVNVSLLVLFFSLIFLLIDFLLLNPSHIQSPSLYKDIAKLITTIDDPSFKLTGYEDPSPYRSDSSRTNDTIETFNIPQKLSGTCIIILIFLMKNANLKNLLAKDLEANLNLNKSTVSYNLKILENNNFISRNTPIESKVKDNISKDEVDLDQRQKRISINQNGIRFLVQLYQYLNAIF